MFIHIIIQIQHQQVSQSPLGQDLYSHKYTQAVKKYVEGHEVISMCPEVEGGLPIPRIPAEIVNGVVTNRDGVSVDKEFRAGAKKILDVLLEEKVELAILQSRSPSCGVGKIYDGTFSRTLIDGNGVFAQLLIDNGIKVIDLEDVSIE